jgi:uncharacterized membrane protein YagU involved in acid resistance
MSQRAERCLTGAIAGLLATVPMTAVMIVGKRRLPPRSQVPLPPVQITQNALRAASVDDEVSRAEEIALSAVNHFGFGASTGVVYGWFCKPRSVANAVTTGCIYGVGVWSCSYLGWLPAAGLYRSAANDTSERNTLMIIAHLVWGAGLGLATHFISNGDGGKLGSEV